MWQDSAACEAAEFRRHFWYVWLVVSRTQGLNSKWWWAETLRHERKISALWQAVSQWWTVQRKTLWLHECRGSRERLRKGSECSHVWGWGMLCPCTAHWSTALEWLRCWLFYMGHECVRDHDETWMSEAGGSHVTHSGLDEWEESEICSRSKQVLVTLLHSCLKVPDKWFVLHTAVILRIIFIVSEFQ